MFSYRAAFGAGVIGALVMSALSGLCRMAMLSDVNFERWLGTFVTRADSGFSWYIGFVWNLVNGGLIGLAYAVIFKAMRRSGSLLGAEVGAFHWVLAGVALGIASSFHPLMPIPIGYPGYFAFNLGFNSMVSLLAYHLLYGLVVGTILSRSSIAAKLGSEKKVEKEPQIRRIA